MIAFLTGRLAGKGPGFALVDVGGVGYRLLMSTQSLSTLPADGDEVTIHTYLLVREDELTLFGFESEAERVCFEALLGVTGVGPKVALATLSSLSPEQLADAVAREDVALVSSVPGVGKKTAQRIILDLSGKLTSGVSGPGSVRAAGAGSEATDALLGMGFSPAEVAAALKDAPAEGDTQSLMKYALRRLGGGA